MKKFFAAMLLSIYLFNIGGQVVLHQYFTLLSDRFFNEQTHKGLYNLDDLTEVKIPINMPGIAEWKGYENVTGQIQFENINYNYVKMRMTSTAMYLMCVPNYQTTHLLDQNIIGAKNIKHIPIPKKDHVPFAKTALVGQFSMSFVHFNFIMSLKTIVLKTVQPVEALFYHSLSIPEQPPRHIC